MKFKKCCLSFGKCNSRYCWFIFGIALIDIISIAIIFIFFFYALKNDIVDINPINVMSYLFFLNLSDSLMIIPSLILNKNTSSKNDNLSKELDDNISVKYIFNQKTSILSLKEKVYLFSFGLLKLFNDAFYISYQFYIEKDYRFIKVLTFSFYFELIFLFLISKIMYNITYYRHQYISIIIITFFRLIKFIIHYSDNGFGFFLGNLFSHIIYSLIKSLITVYIKGLMDYKFISPYKACYIYGMINLLITTIVYLIATFIPCESDICNIEYNGKYYFGNIFSIFNISIIFMILYFILKSVLLVLNYNIIHNFSVCHSFLIYQFSQLFEFGPFVAFGFGDLSDSYPALVMILIFFVINTFFVLLFLEIIEINICKMNYNTKRNIEKRARIDSQFSDLIVINDDEETDYDN